LIFGFVFGQMAEKKKQKIKIKKLDKVKNILTFAVPTKRELLKRSLVTYKIRKIELLEWKLTELWTNKTKGKQTEKKAKIYKRVAVRVCSISSLKRCHL
jgi:hypothetical protein